MKSTVNFFPALLLLITVSLNGQPGYLAGTGQAVIEPYESLISLHLGGYGAPRDGRFTLQWKLEGSTPDAVAMTGLNGKLFILQGSEIMWTVPSESNIQWKSAGKAENILSVSGDNETLFALKADGELLESKLSGNIKWKKRGLAQNSSKLITATSGILYATDGKGTLWSTQVSDKTLTWEKSTMVSNIISFSSDKGKLYALTTDGIIFRLDTRIKDGKWMKIAYRNNETIKEDIKLISFLNDRIYGISRDNNLYIGEHRTEGNLTARALAVKGGTQTVVIVNVDICGLTGNFTGLI